MRLRSLPLLSLLAGSTLVVVEACSSSTSTGGLAGGVGASGAGAGSASGSGSGSGNGGGTTGTLSSTTASGLTTSTSSAATGSSTGTAATGGSTSASSGGAGGSATSTSSGATSSGATSSGTSSSSGTTSSASASSSSGSPVTFGQSCDGGTTTLTGTVYAPNGTDPIPNVRVYAAIQINPYPPNYCDKCSAPIDPAYVSTKSAADGTFTLDLTGIPQMASIDFAIQIGRFRKHTTLPINACTSTAVPKADETLPGNSKAGDIPKMAVSTGNADHLDSILTALGITEWDCYEGRANPNSAGCTPLKNPTTKASYTIADVLTNTNAANGPAISTYNMAFLSCAPDAYGTFVTPKGQMFKDGTYTYPGQGYDQTTMSQNTASWVGGGGRLFVTDTAYDYVAQAFPGDITWQGAAGSPQPVDGANVGCAPANPMYANAHAVPYPVNIDDPTLAAWLKVVGFSTSPSVPIQGFYQPWSAMSSLATTTTLIADGTMPVDLSMSPYVCQSSTMQDVPLTAQFDVPTCGRVIFSSYHTYTGTGASANAANAQIMEYLIFGAAVCTTQ